MNVFVTSPDVNLYATASRLKIVEDGRKEGRKEGGREDVPSIPLSL